MSLFYKAWLESKGRFLAGIAAVIAVCTLYLRLRPILVPDWILDLQNPHLHGQPNWLYRGIHDVNFYSWHFLYENKLQQVWVLFAILLSFGGLVRERQSGTSTFSLSLPVSRRKWFLTRMLVAAAESLLLALTAVLAISLSSWSIHERYGSGQMLAHCLLIAGAGALFLALGALFSTVVRGEHIALPLTLIVIGIPYLFIQEFMREAPTAWLRALDISHVMAGPPNLSWATAPWVGLALSLSLAIGIFWLAVRIGESIEY